MTVFIASDPDRWAPLDRRNHRAVVGATVADPGAPAFAPSAAPPAPAALPAKELQARVWAAVADLWWG